MKKNTGTRIRAIVRTPEKQREHRAEQAARAILAGRGSREANWTRIARAFPGFGSAEKAVAWVHNLGLATVPAFLLDEAFPTPPEPVVETADEPTVKELGALVTDPIFGEVLEIELEPLPVVEATV